MKPIGGYFGLHSCGGSLPHPKAYPVNFGRGGLELILRARKYRRVWIPDYICPCVPQFLDRLGVIHKSYAIEANLEPAELPRLAKGDALSHPQHHSPKRLLLGGIRYLLSGINAAHDLGVYVIIAPRIAPASQLASLGGYDYLPDNIAHRYSDEYVNVSILDRDAVLAIAREKHIDGILSFGVDPGVITAAYVAEKLGLPFPPLASVEILQNKDRFRDFLSTHGFNCPFHFSYASKEAALSDERLRQKLVVEKISVIVKPVDSAGSKGCSRYDPNVDPDINSQLSTLNSGRLPHEESRHNRRSRIRTRNVQLRT